MLFRSIVDYYNSKGSTVYTATLDISKAFDMINHYKLFDLLIKAGFPGWIIDILVNWYSKLTVKVRWNANSVNLIWVVTFLRICWLPIVCR